MEAMFEITSLNESPVLSLPTSVVLLLGLLLLSACNLKPAQSAKREAAPSPAGSNEDRLKGSTGDEMAAGDAAAAGFSARHQAHAGKTGQEIQRFGLALTYPGDWEMNTKVPKEGPIALNTFGSHYSERGGHFPTHGAEIDVSYLARPKGSALQIMQSDSQGSDELKIDQLPFRVGGAAAVRASYTDSYKGYLAHRTGAVYAEHGDGLYKFFLTYHKDEALGPEFVKDFNEILRSVRFSQ